jgi:hypothetical protein
VFEVIELRNDTVYMCLEYRIMVQQGLGRFVCTYKYIHNITIEHDVHDMHTLVKPITTSSTE